MRSCGLWNKDPRNSFGNFTYLKDYFLDLSTPPLLPGFFYCYRFLLRIVYLFAFILSTQLVHGQQLIEKKLEQNVSEARSDSERIVSLGQLSQYYYANKDFQKGDSLIENQIMLA